VAGITILTDIVAPNSLWEAGVVGKQIRKNKRGETQSGIMRVNVVWSHTKRQFVWGTVPHSIAVWQTLEGLFEATDAGAYGFLLIDPKDPRATHDNGRATLISAGAHTYQLVKRYTAITSSQTRDRPIRYTTAAGIELKILGVTKTAGGDYTLDDETGIVTIPSDPTASDITWAAPFYVPVHFADDELEWKLEAAGSEAQRLLVGPRIVLDEVKQ